MKRWKRPKIVLLYLLKIVGTEIYKIGYTTREISERIRHIRFYVGEVNVVETCLCEFETEKFLHDVFYDKIINHPNGYKEYFKLTQDDVNDVLSFFKSKKQSIP